MSRSAGPVSRSRGSWRGLDRQVDRLSVVMIAIAAALWATDAYFRGYLLTRLSAGQVTLGEDVLIALPLAPLLVTRRAELRRLGRLGWLAAVVVGVGPQAIATVMFTASLDYHEFAVSYVLQQLQPLIAVLLAGLLLGERRRSWYWPGLVAALAGAYLVVFAPDLTAPLTALPSARAAAAALALGAAALWALGTVLGRYLLRSVSFPTMTSLRVTLALPVLIGIVLADQNAGALAGYRASEVPDLLGLALIPGLLALLLYYRALDATPASLSTIAEMAYPVMATIIASAPPPLGFGQALYPAQVAGTAVLAAAILVANWRKSAVVVAPEERGPAARAGAP